MNTEDAPKRRKPRLKDLDAVLAEAESLAAAPVETMGNWSLGQIFSHLARAMNLSIDGFEGTSSWFVRTFLGPLLKWWILRKTMPSGYRLRGKFAEELVPPETSAEEGLQQLRAAVIRVQTEQCTAPHVVFGRMSHQDWLRLHCRHAELHLGFVRPAE
ncbi:MAG: DUF1569 domain-containing protein [Planctomycetales bacterium]